MRDALKISDKSANAAEIAAYATKAATVAQLNRQRPLLVCDPPVQPELIVTSQWLEDGIKQTFKLTFDPVVYRNWGNSLAWLDGDCAATDVVADNDSAELPPVPVSSMANVELIKPDGGYRQSLSMELSRDQFESLILSKKQVMLYGVITYEDSLGLPFTSRYCFVYRHNGASNDPLALPQHYNAPLEAQWTVRRGPARYLKDPDGEMMCHKASGGVG